MVKKQYYEKRTEHYRQYSRDYYRTHPKYRERLKSKSRERNRRLRDIAGQNPAISARMRADKATYMKAYMKKYVDNLRAQWGSTNKLISIESERVVVENVLPALGFSEIFWVSHVKKHFFVDILGKQNGIKYAVEVCSGVFKQFSRTEQKILGFLGLRLIVCFIRPNLQEFRLMEVPLDKTAILVNNKKHLLQEGKLQVC